MKKIVIIGGGIAGLSAGVYAQKAGFQSVIYEKNPIVGGQCMGWNREDCHIDNCIHWLTGTKKGTDLRRVWEELGALTPDTRFAKTDRFYQSSLNGQTVTLWKDLDRTEKELVAASPEDEEEIRKFIEAVRLAQCCEIPVEKPMEMMNLKDYIKLGKKMAGMAKVSKEYKKMDVGDLAMRFQSPLLRTLFTDYILKEYIVSSYIVSYATVASGNGDVPMGGSLAMALRIAKQYGKLGGKIYTGIGAAKVRICGKKASGVELADGSFVPADYVICATDTAEAFGRLIGNSYMDKNWKKTYENRVDYPVFSGVQMAFSVDADACRVVDTEFFHCDPPLAAGASTMKRMSVRSYAFDPSLAPKGKTVLQSNLPQKESDYEFWKGLDEESYRKEKSRLSAEVEKQILRQYPELVGHCKLLDCWTPLTYERYCNSFRGAYMSFETKKGIKSHTFTGKLKGLYNVLLASQWMQSPGGLPVAAVVGKFSIQRILKLEKRTQML